MNVKISSILQHVNQGCLRCGSGDETVIHTFKDCLKARVILSHGGIDRRLLDTIYERSIDWLEATMHLMDRKAFEDFVTILWNIWNNNNSALFHGKEEDMGII